MTNLMGAEHLPHTTDAIDEDIDRLLEWERVLAVVRSSAFTDTERVAFVFFFLGVSTVDMARLITKPDGTPITREWARQLVRRGLTKIFNAFDAGDSPTLRSFISSSERGSAQRARRDNVRKRSD